MSFFDLDPDAQIKVLEEVAVQALNHWRTSDADLRLIKYRENAVFEVRDGTHRSALRLHRLGYHSDAALASELLWMQALAEAGIRVPDLISAADGRHFVTVDHPEMPGPVQVDRFAWVEGQILGSVEEGIADESEVAANYQLMGALAGRVHNQASVWSPPASFVRHAWDAEGLAGRQPFWGQFWRLASATDAERALLEAGRDRVFADLSALDRSGNVYSMIHADFAPENLMVDGDGVRLIDFDDAGFGWHLFELATSLYFIWDEPYFAVAKNALIAGYRSERPLSDDHLALLPLMLVARGFTYLGWVHTRQETETARELTPMLLDQSARLTRSYLEGTFRL
ncbi:MAG: phosphotransferase [Pseudomonadota bacterium]